jgi:hypothetical protein
MARLKVIVLGLLLLIFGCNDDKIVQLKRKILT